MGPVPDPEVTIHEDASSPLLRSIESGGGRRVEMLCPKCESWQDILAYKNPDVVRKYANTLNPIVKCMNCRHLFSPRWLGS